MALALTQNADNIYDIGSFDAKTYFAELLRMIQNGATINITKNGKKVAVMESPKAKANSQSMLAHQRILKRSAEISKYAKENNLQVFSLEEINEAKNYGRK